jgi:hypothetical protein
MFFWWSPCPKKTSIDAPLRDAFRCSSVQDMMNYSNSSQGNWCPNETELRFLVEPQVSPYRGPLFFTRSLETVVGEYLVASGGFGLVDTGQRKLLITCHHVWEGFEEERRKNSNVRLCICLDGQPPVVFDQYQPVDQDRTLDIATFDITPVLEFCGGRRFYPLNRNPPPRVAKGDWVVVLGNQGLFRLANEEGLCFGVTTYALKVSDASRSQVVADLSNARMKYKSSPPLATNTNASPHGGISGSPCFLMRKNKQARLIGFATADWKNSIWFTHIRCLNADGTINRDVR